MAGSTPRGGRSGHVTTRWLLGGGGSGPSWLSGLIQLLEGHWCVARLVPDLFTSPLTVQFNLQRLVCQFFHRQLNLQETNFFLQFDPIFVYNVSEKD